MSFCWSSRAERTSPTTPTISTGTLPLVTSKVLPIGFSLPKTDFAPDCADQDDIRVIEHVLLVEIATGQERDAQGPEPSRRDVVGGRAFALRDGRNVAIRARVERRAAAIEERKPAADRRFLHTGRGAQGARHLLGETRAGSDVRILRLRHDGESDPEILGLETGILMAQPHETRDEQRRARRPG